MRFCGLGQFVEERRLHHSAMGSLNHGNCTLARCKCSAFRSAWQFFPAFLSRPMACSTPVPSIERPTRKGRPFLLGSRPTSSTGSDLRLVRLAFQRYVIADGDFAAFNDEAVKCKLAFEAFVNRSRDLLVLGQRIGVV
ncbi:MAG: hypothetical protein JWM57_2677 [Phycisphaerales bacterium]|nr:hypothetical protein [Phycisphaerales bacterium]